mmetsp:Transcript_58323/g.165855  ORF Transcript_58323/g.165855 Transcript_58323/m.165855 type:complete len:212 (-) Transcript_58323:254-889(-)
MKCGPVCAPVCGTGRQGPPEETDILSFLKDEGTKSVKWTFVGEGRGTFQPVQNYDYVGHGLGSYQQQVTPPPPPTCCSRQRVYLGLGLLLAAVVLVGLLTMPRLRQAAAPSVQTEAFNCKLDFATWRETWSSDKKDWCCANKGKACEATGDCNSQCAFARHTATCRARIQWGADHRFLHQPDSCASSHQMVLGQCPVCQGCALANTGCQPS